MVQQLDYADMRRTLFPTRVTPGYPQNVLRPSDKGCVTCTAMLRIDDDTRRNMAGLQLGKLGLLPLKGLRGVGLRGFYDYVSANPGAYAAWMVLSAVSVGASAFHGYRRNRGSIGWALGWGLLGGLFPIITPAIALAQGYGKPAKRR